jgi:hypothetical protein
MEELSAASFGSAMQVHLGLARAQLYIGGDVKFQFVSTEHSNSSNPSEISEFR